MKKSKKILLIAVFCLVSLLFASSVSAKAEVEYPVYADGEEVHFFDYHSGHTQGRYTVSEDDGIKDGEVRLTGVTDPSETFTVSKEALAYGYVASATKDLDLDLPGEYEEQGDFDITAFEEVTKVVYLKNDDAIINAIKNAKKFDNVYSIYGIDSGSEDIVIPEDVTVTSSGLYVSNLENNGIIKVQYISANKITGKGVINISYTTDGVGDGDGPQSDEIFESYRIQCYNITGVKINIIDIKLEDKTPFGYIGPVKDFSKEEAQKIIDMYNKVLGDKLSSFKVELATINDFSFNSDIEKEDYYYGSLVKKEVVTTTSSKDETKKETKDEVKNPKTSDNIMFIVGGIMLSALGFGITLKKVKQK